jgi:hypothetical protein
MAITAAMKKVLSPISLSKTITQDLLSPAQKEAIQLIVSIFEKLGVSIPPCRHFKVLPPCRHFKIQSCCCLWLRLTDLLYRPGAGPQPLLCSHHAASVGRALYAAFAGAAHEKARGVQRYETSSSPLKPTTRTLYLNDA